MANSLEGRTIKVVRLMTSRELQLEGWDRPATAIELDDGTLIYPSKDSEGNGPGVFFGLDEGRQVSFSAKE